MFSCHICTGAWKRLTDERYYWSFTTPQTLRFFISTSHTGLLSTPVLDCGMTDKCSITLVFLLNFVIFIYLMFFWTGILWRRVCGNDGIIKARSVDSFTTTRDSLVNTKCFDICWVSFTVQKNDATSFLIHGLIMLMLGCAGLTLLTEAPPCLLAIVSITRPKRESGAMKKG